MTDIAAGKIPVLKCFEAAWRFFFASWRLFLPAAVVPAVANGVSLLLSPVSVEGATTNLLGDFIGVMLAGIASVFFMAAVLRKYLRDEFIPPFGLAFGEDETRLFVALGFFLALFLPPIVIGWTLFQVLVLSRIAPTPEALAELMADPEKLSEAVIGAIGPGGVLALDILLVAAIVIGVIAAVKLSMVNAATIGERRVVFFQTWGWSKGNVLRMIAAMLLTSLPALLANLIVAELVASIAAGAGGAVPAVMLAGTLLGFVGSMLGIPAIALGATLYKGLRPPDFAAK
jgi:hypothetical protein